MNLKMRIERLLIGAYTRALVESIEQDCDDWFLNDSPDFLLYFRHKTGLSAQLHECRTVAGEVVPGHWKFRKADNSGFVQIGGLFGNRYVNFKMKSLVAKYRQRQIATA